MEALSVVESRCTVTCREGWFLEYLRYPQFDLKRSRSSFPVARGLIV